MFSADNACSKQRKHGVQCIGCHYLGSALFQALLAMYRKFAMFRISQVYDGDSGWK